MGRFSSREASEGGHEGGYAQDHAAKGALGELFGIR